MRRASQSAPTNRNARERPLKTSQEQRRPHSKGLRLRERANLDGGGGRVRARMLWALRHTMPNGNEDNPNKRQRRKTPPEDHARGLPTHGQGKPLPAPCNRKLPEHAHQWDRLARRRAPEGEQRCSTECAPTRRRQASAPAMPRFRTTQADNLKFAHGPPAQHNAINRLGPQTKCRNPTRRLTQQAARGKHKGQRL